MAAAVCSARYPAAMHHHMYVSTAGNPFMRAGKSAGVVRDSILVLAFCCNIVTRQLEAAVSRATCIHCSMIDNGIKDTANFHNHDGAVLLLRILIVIS